MLEYEEVLKRNGGALALTSGEVDQFPNAICHAADCFQLPPPRAPRLPDYDDEPLSRLAEASGARLITTPNLRHLARAAAYGVTVLPPRECQTLLRCVATSVRTASALAKAAPPTAASAAVCR